MVYTYDGMLFLWGIISTSYLLVLPNDLPIITYYQYYYKDDEGFHSVDSQTRSLRKQGLEASPVSHLKQRSVLIQY